MKKLTDYIDSIQVSLNDIKQRIHMQEDEFNASKSLTEASKIADYEMGVFRDMFFTKPEE